MEKQLSEIRKALARLADLIPNGAIMSTIADADFFNLVADEIERLNIIIENLPNQEEIEKILAAWLIPTTLGLRYKLSRNIAKRIGTLNE
ncbi:MAG: hypothetical protein ABIF08_00245 [Nanoarchaeota archaeon]